MGVFILGILLAMYSKAKPRSASARGGRNEQSNPNSLTKLASSVTRTYKETVHLLCSQQALFLNAVNV